MSLWLSIAIVVVANLWAVRVLRRQKRRRNDAEDMRRLHALGIVRMTANYPDVLLRVLGRAGD